MKYLIIIILSITLFTISCNKGSSNNNDNNNNTQKKNGQYVIILSLDGFRHDYSSKTSTPNFDKIENIGVKSIVKSSFPTKTFPNHYTIATGLYPNNHGIVNNSFWDPTRQVKYKISDRSKVEDGYFYGGEPIWVTAEKQGVRSASFFWVGSEAPIKGYRPSIWKTYDHNFPFYQRADSVIAWLKLPEEKRPHLITWYLSQPDSYGHKYGPNSQQITDTIAGLDKIIGYFMNNLAKLDIADSVNFIITSDHGMQEITYQKSLALMDYLNSDWLYSPTGGNPTYNIWAKEGFKDSIENALSNVDHLNLYKKSNIPERLHYMTNDRCGDFVVTADSSWALFIDNIPNFTVGGTHGYDNDISSMDAIFYAYGPAFKQNYTHPKFSNVEIYNIMCNILKLDAAPNDGNLNNVKEMLNN